MKWAYRDFRNSFLVSRGGKLAKQAHPALRSQFAKELFEP